jgi:hypothetical protein
MAFGDVVWSRVFVLFESKNAMISVIDTINQWNWIIREFKYFKKHFLFNYQDAMKDRFDSWVYFDGESALV